MLVTDSGTALRMCGRACKDYVDFIAGLSDNQLGEFKPLKLAATAGSDGSGANIAGDQAGIEAR
ncbi:MAG: hypothetical protein AAF202_01740 [Pseudomonadota bacterium]